MSKDYYKILEVKEDATQEQIKEAYRKMVFQYHPDRNKDDPTAGQKMKEINEAYAVLSDPKKRREYDTLRQSVGSNAYSRFRESYSEEDIFRNSDIDQMFEQVAKMFGFRNFEEIFQEFYGSRYQTFEFRRPGFSGRGFIIHGYRPHKKNYNRGQKEFPGSPYDNVLNKFFKHTFKDALGETDAKKGKDLYDVLVLSPEQAQNGGKIEYSCEKWGRHQKLAVKVPPGINEGQKIKLKGLGADGKDGGENGDLFLKVKIKTPLWNKIKTYFNHFKK